MSKVSHFFSGIKSYIMDHAKNIHWFDYCFKSKNNDGEVKISELNPQVTLPGTDQPIDVIIKEDGPMREELSASSDDEVGTRIQYRSSSADWTCDEAGSSVLDSLGSLNLGGLGYDSDPTKRDSMSEIGVGSPNDGSAL